MCGFLALVRCWTAVWILVLVNYCSVLSLLALLLQTRQQFRAFLRSTDWPRLFPDKRQYFLESKRCLSFSLLFLSHSLSLLYLLSIWFFFFFLGFYLIKLLCWKQNWNQTHSFKSASWPCFLCLHRCEQNHNDLINMWYLCCDYVYSVSFSIFIVWHKTFPVQKSGLDEPWGPPRHDPVGLSVVVMYSSCCICMCPD